MRDRDLRSTMIKKFIPFLLLLGVCFTPAALPYTDTLDPATPAGTDSPTAGDDRIRELKRAFVERLDTDHTWPASGGVYDGTTVGYHDKITFLEQASAPALATTAIVCYSKADGTLQSIYCKNEEGIEFQVTTLNQLLLIQKAVSSAPTTGTDEGAFYVKTSGATTKPYFRAEASGTETDLSLGYLIQVVNTQTGAVATGTTTTPDDDTIPQITEGTEFMTRSITPTSATTVLLIDVHVNIATAAGADLPLIIALHQDSTANALAAIREVTNTTNNYDQGYSFSHCMVSGTTSSTTFKVRVGSSTAGTITFNGASGARKLGGVMASSIRIQEVNATTCS